MSGPRPTPTYLKLLKGNLGRRRLNKNGQLGEDLFDGIEVDAVGGRKANRTHGTCIGEVMSARTFH